MNFGDNFEDINKIFYSLDKKEQLFITDEDFEDKKLVKYRKVLYLENEPISFIELYVPKNFVREGYIVIGTKKEFRRMGYSRILVQKAEEELKELSYNKLYWIFKEENEISKNMAISLGYKYLKGRTYYKKIR